ncbi:MAG: ZIP family metal transporter [Acidobacteriota bacterium]|nr:ZIP family metal transporter [Acidobacteriota bacterium]
MGLPLLAFTVALAGVVPGLYLSKVPRVTRYIILLSGVLLLGVSLFGLLPELAEEIGWLRGVPVFAAGYCILLVFDRYTGTVCPGCSHGHNHKDCESALHGFTIPLACAAAAHAFLDGWGLASVGPAASTGVRLAFPAAVLVHKLPEGIALGAILKSSTSSRPRAIVWAGAAESATLVGAFAGMALTPRLGSAWTNYPLALAGGCFLYLGYHALHIGWTRARV